jgi:ketosteroid isomerase-like protein
MSSTEEELVTLSHAWMRAIVTNKAADVEAYMADEWVLVTPQAGPVGKQQFLGAIQGGDLTHEAMGTVGDVSVRVYGDTATLVSRVQNRGAYAGEPFTYDEWSTDVYVRSYGQWRCVLTALTPVTG